MQCVTDSYCHGRSAHGRGQRTYRVLGVIDCGNCHSQKRNVELCAKGVAVAEIFATDKVSKVTIDESKPGLKRGYVYDITKAENELNWKPVYDDMYKMYTDYKREWISKEYHNFHEINEEDRPKTL